MSLPNLTMFLCALAIVVLALTVAFLVAASASPSPNWSRLPHREHKDDTLFTKVIRIISRILRVLGS